MCFLAITACSSINSAKVGTLEIENGISYRGKIVSIEKKQLTADFSKRISGSLLGHFIATGLGANKGLKWASAIVESAIVDKEYGEYGEYIDLIEVQSAQGQRYTTYVPVNYFSINAQVDFIAEKSMINSSKSKNLLPES
jgi:outer membrane lipoprotein SlyB